MWCRSNKNIVEMNNSTVTVVYGDQSNEQYFRLHYPHTEDPCPVIVIIHGGFWMQGYALDNALINTVAPYFVSNGFVACEIEYRRGNPKIDRGRGGWPRTNEDISKALVKLHSVAVENDTEAKMDMSRVVILGHSAGGTLALWACGYSDALPRPHPEASLFTALPFKPLLCVAVAPIGDLAEGHRRGLSSDGRAVVNYMGCEPLPSADGSPNPNCPYTLASPSNLLPLKCKCLVVAGTADYIVPQPLIESYLAKAVSAANRSGTPVPEMLLLRNSDHFQLVSTKSKYWAEIYDRIMQCMH